MEIQVTSQDLKKLGRDLKRAGQKDLQKEALKRMRAEVQPLVPEIRARIRQTPGGHSDRLRTTKARAARPRKLRDAEARGVQVKASLTGKYAGVRIRIDTRHLPDGDKNLFKYREGLISPWRSPTFGHGPWKVQRAHPTFYPTIRPHIPEVQAGVLKIVNDISERVMRSGGT